MAKPKWRHPKHAAALKRNVQTQLFVDALRAWLGMGPLYGVGPKAQYQAKRKSRQKL